MELYATDRSFIDYTFKVISETETTYDIKDVSTSSFELSQTIFTIDKFDFKLIYSTDEKWNFIFRENGFFISDKKEQVLLKVNEYLIENYNHQLKELPEQIATLEIKLKNIENTTFFKFNTDELNIGDNVILLTKERKYIGKVTSFITADKINFNPLITCKYLSLYNVEISTDDNTNYIDYDYPDGGGVFCRVFKNNNDLDNYLQVKKIERLRELIFYKKGRISLLTKQMIMLQKDKV